MIEPASAGESRPWWPDYDTLSESLRRIGRGDVADALRDAVQGGATSAEILGRVGLVLRAHDGVRADLTLGEKRAWDAVMRDVNRSQPPRAVTYWLRRLFRP